MGAGTDDRRKAYSLGRQMVEKAVHLAIDTGRGQIERGMVEA